MWPWASLGLHYSAKTFNALVFSAFQFVAQLEAVPPEVLRMETALLRKAAPGPGNWCRPGELWHLRTHYGCPASFRSLTLTGLATLARVAKFENRLHGGLRAEVRSQQLWHWRCTSRFQARADRWDSWYCSAPVTVLTDAWSTLRQKGITHTRIELHAAKGAPRPWSREAMDKIRKGYQKSIVHLLTEQDGYNAEKWSRRKLTHWGLPDRRDADRHLRRLSALQTQVAPRVLAALLKCAWNGWATARRRQTRANPCLLGCGTGEDAIEHYAQCRVTHAAARKWLRMPPPLTPLLHHWALGAPACVVVERDPGWWVKTAILVYAVQHTTNAARHAGGPLLAEHADRALRQAMIEGARDSPATASLRYRGPGPPPPPNNAGGGGN